MTISVEPLTGDGLVAALPDLAQLRITVFHDWPYLYEGTLAYERCYMEKFSKSEGAVIVAARDGQRIIGAATGSPMTGHADEFAEPFRQRGYDIAKIFYCGESVLLKEYRGRGIGHAFFEHREAHARRLGGFTHSTFCAVVRPDDHPMRPGDYVPLDAFWVKRGYRKVDGLTGEFSWRDVGETTKTKKPMQFWMKAL